MMKTQLAWFWHVTRHNSLSLQGTLEDGQRWSAEEMLDGQYHARTADKGLLQKRLEEDLLWKKKTQNKQSWD